ncbi:MAG: terminase large subunit [Bryobacterales bacterium]|nr:terminase large subunit [Bryobacterales bacterium]MDE0293695.1 terminase large subunit [Bryobacterales bacterium]
MKLLPFQRRYIDAPNQIKCLSLPRGNGKSTLCAYHLAHVLETQPNTSNYVFAHSLGQARDTIFKEFKRFINQDDYRISDSTNNICRAIHKKTKSVLYVRSANPKSAMGMVGANLIVCDEPGAWEVNAGEALWDAIETSLGKPGDKSKVFVVGTRAPVNPVWFQTLLADPNNYADLMVGSADKWSDLRHVYSVNPVMRLFPESRKKLTQERDQALNDPRLKARFLSYRLNLPSQDESSTLLTVSDWKRCLARPVPPREGRPVVGVDLGAGRAWSAAVAVWRNQRVEAVALCPGLPSVREQERRDKVSAGTYQRLVDAGSLIVAQGLHIPPVSGLLSCIAEWNPQVIVCDRFRLQELKDARPPCDVIPRISRWSESSQDIRATRAMSKDGQLSIDPESRDLLEHSLSVTTVVNDDAGNVMIKKSKNNTARDDLSSALVLACGVVSRFKEPRPFRYVVCR